MGRITKSDGTEMDLGPNGWAYTKIPGRWENGVDNGITIAELLARMPQGDAPNVIPSSQAQQVAQVDRMSPIDYMGRKGFRQSDGRILDANGALIADLNGVQRLQAQQNALAQQDADIKRKALLADLMEKNQKIYAGTPEGMREKMRIEAEAKGMETTAKAQAEAAQNLPKAEQFANEAKQLIEGMIGKRDEQGNLVAGSAPHSGFETAVGATLMPGLRFIDGTDTADFMSRLGQVKGGAFLQAFEALKGGGAITEVEGAKATQALNRMDKSQSEKEFVKAAQEFITSVNRGLEGARRKAGITQTQPAQQGAGIQPGTRRNGYVYIGGNPSLESSWKKE